MEQQAKKEALEAYGKDLRVELEVKKIQREMEDADSKNDKALLDEKKRQYD
jgi:hypothetical protein